MAIPSSTRPIVLPDEPMTVSQALDLGIPVEIVQPQRRIVRVRRMSAEDIDSTPPQSPVVSELSQSPPLHTLSLLDYMQVHSPSYGDSYHSDSYTDSDVPVLIIDSDEDADEASSPADNADDDDMSYLSSQSPGVRPAMLPPVDAPLRGSLMDEPDDAVAASDDAAAAADDDDSDKENADPLQPAVNNYYCNVHSSSPPSSPPSSPLPGCSYTTPLDSNPISQIQPLAPMPERRRQRACRNRLSLKGVRMRRRMHLL